MTTQIPAGCRQNAQGHFIPESMIKPIDLERDRLVRHLVDRASELSGELADFKTVAFGDIEAFIELSAEQYGAKLGGKKGNVTLLSFDGRGSKPVVRGTEPSRPVDWAVKAWFIVGHEKHTHTAVAKQETVAGLAAYMGALIDTLIEDHGNQVSACGWESRMLHKKKRGKK